MGTPDMPDAHTLFQRVTGKTLTAEQRVDFAAKIHSVDRGAIKRWEVEEMKEGSSDILLRYGSGVEMPYTDFLKEDGDEDDEDDASEDEEDEEDEEQEAEQQSEAAQAAARKSEAAGSVDVAAAAPAGDGAGPSDAVPTA